MTLNFTKMHGCGNDYIYFDCLNETINNPEEISKKLTDRHFSIGGDGIVLICPSNVADAKMRMFNMDGSEGKMCGNAIRCVGKYLSDNNIINKDTVRIETLSGIKILELQKENNVVTAAKVNMGPAILNPKEIPVLINNNNQPIISHPVIINDKEFKITCVSMGNPHCIIFCDDVNSIDLADLGPQFENNKMFPDKVNVEFVEILNENKLKMRVWERGSGETMACGTGACAAVVAAVENGFCDKGKYIPVELLGGELKICYTNETVFMVGEAVVSFKGEVTI